MLDSPSYVERMEPKINSSLVYLGTVKQVWTNIWEMFSGVGNLKRTYDLHHAFFSLSIDDMSLEDFYGKFRSICKEIDLRRSVCTV